MLRVSLLFTVIVGLGCRSSDPAPAPGEPDAPQAQQPQVVAGGPHADHERVQACFPPAVLRCLLEADTLELFSLICEREADPDEETLGTAGYVIRSVVDVAPPERAQILDALFGDVVAGEDVAECFVPHHALRARRGQEEALIVICYACSQLEVWQGEELVGSSEIGDEGAAVLNRALGQTTSVPPDEVQGRPVRHWADVVLNWHAVAPDEDDRDPSNYVEAAGALYEALLTCGDPASLALVREALTQRYASRTPVDVRDVGTAIHEAVEHAEHLNARLAAVELAHAVAEQEGESPRDPSVMHGITVALIELLLEEVQPESDDPKPNSPELRERAKQALALCRPPADWIPDLVTQAKALDDPEQRKDLVEFFGSLGGR